MFQNQETELTYDKISQAITDIKELDVMLNNCNRLEVQLNDFVKCFTACDVKNDYAQIKLNSICATIQKESNGKLKANQNYGIWVSNATKTKTTLLCYTLNQLEYLLKIKRQAC